jgi:hypothetical protein
LDWVGSFAIFRRAKSAAAGRGIPLREFVTEAVREKLAAGANTTEKPWMKHFGKLKHLHKETLRINRRDTQSATRDSRLRPFLAGARRHECLGFFAQVLAGSRPRIAQ